MMGHWKMMDDMKDTDKNGYDDYIKNMKSEWEGEKKKVDAEKEKKRIIMSQPICSIKLRVAKIVVQKKQKDLSETIKLFDFDQNAEMNKTVIGEDETQGKPLDQPKFYLNLVYHEKVLPPQKKDKTPADKNNDKEWGIIPISFSPSKERWSGSGMKCIHVDAHLNTCVMENMKKGGQAIAALTNYVILKFQALLKDHYVFHKKHISIIKSHKYKANRGPHDVVPEYILPPHFHVDHHKKALDEAKDLLKMLDPNFDPFN
jgi:hypothetical protein